MYPPESIEKQTESPLGQRETKDTTGHRCLSGGSINRAHTRLQKTGAGSWPQRNRPPHV